MPPRISHLTYYDYQVEARGIHSAADVQADAANKAFVYDRLVLPKLPANRSARIVELACGHGAFLAWAGMHGFKDLLGVDSSPAQVSAARAAGVNAEEVDISVWLAAQAPSSVAALVAIDLIEHLPKDDFMTLLAEASRVLVPGGSLILRYPNGDSPFVGLNLFNDITHVWTYTSNCVETLSRMHHFSSARFADEGWRVARDHRWLKLPLGRICESLLGSLVRMAAREKVTSFSPNAWAFLQR